MSGRNPIGLLHWMLCHSEATQPWGENVSSQRVPYQCFNCFLAAATQECWFRTCQHICYRATTVRFRCGLIFCSFNFQDKHWKLGLHIVSFIYDWLSITYLFFAYSNSHIYIIIVNVFAHVCLQKTLLEIVGCACWVFMLKKAVMMPWWLLLVSMPFSTAISFACCVCCWIIHSTACMPLNANTSHAGVQLCAASRGHLI